MTLTLITADELLQMPDQGCYELIRGKLHRMRPAGFEPGNMALNIGSRLKEHISQTGQGKVVAAENRSQTDITILKENYPMSGGDVLPGFSCKVAELFV